MKPAPIPTTTAATPRAKAPTPAAVRPPAASTVIQETASDPGDPWAPSSAERLANLAPGSRIAIVRRGAGGRWAPAYGYKAG